MLIPSSPPSAVVLIVNGFISTTASPASFVSPFAVAEVVVVVAVVGVVNVVATEVGDASFGSDVGADDGWKTVRFKILQSKNSRIL